MSKLAKKTVELKPGVQASRIRRDPVRRDPMPADQPKSALGRIDFRSREWEIALGLAGIVAFALALNVIWIGFTAWMSR